MMQQQQAQAQPPPTTQQQVCRWCHTGARHPLFLYLILDSRIGLEQLSNKRQFHVGLSSNPLAHVRCQNRERGFRAGMKSTKQVAPHWELNMTVKVDAADAQAHKAACTSAASKWAIATTWLQLGTLLCRYFATVAHQQHTTLYVKDIEQFHAIVNHNNHAH